MKKITVIIALHNREKYIKECINSLLKQSLNKKNIEVIIIDDCSTDNSLILTEKLIKDNKDIFTLIKHEQNKGPGGARNTGIKNATGEYITFLDADDYLETDALAFSFEKMEKNDIDLMVFPHNTIGNLINKKDFNPATRLFNSSKIIKQKELYKYPEFIFSLQSWNKVYKKSLIKKLDYFLENQLYNEDAKFSFQAFTKAKNIYISTKALYNYRKDINNKSATQANYKKKDSYFDHSKHHLYLLNFVKINSKYKKAIYWYNWRNWYPFMSRVLKKEIKLLDSEYTELFEISKKILEPIPSSFNFPGNSLYYKNFYSIIKNNKNFTNASNMFIIRDKILSKYYSIKTNLLFWR